MSSARWYAWIDGAAQGPFQPSELAGRGADLLVCREGAEAWIAAVTVPELAAVVAGPAAPGGAAATRYYTYIAGQTQGPYTVDHLKPFLQPGLMVCREGTESWVAAKDVPELAAQTSVPSPSALAMPPLTGGAPGSAAHRLSPLAAPSPLAGSPSAAPLPAGGPAPAPLPAPMPARSASAAPEAAPRDLPPLLKELWLICRNASDELLAEQKKKQWKKFFKNEQAIISAEIARRGLKV